PSAKTSTLIRSLRLKRLESRPSRYQMFGCLKKLRGRSARRDEPPEQLTPPPGVEPLDPKEAGEIDPLMVPVYLCPENEFKIGAMVQPLKIALAAPSLNGFGLYTTLATNFCRRSNDDKAFSLG